MRIVSGFGFVVYIIEILAPAIGKSGRLRRLRGWPRLPAPNFREIRDLGRRRVGRAHGTFMNSDWTLVIMAGRPRTVPITGTVTSLRYCVSGFETETRTPETCSRATGLRDIGRASPLHFPERFGGFQPTRRFFSANGEFSDRINRE